MKTLHVDLAENAYDIHIGSGILKDAGKLIRTVYQGKRAVVISDTNVWELHSDTLMDSLEQAGIEAASVVLAAGEQTKQIESLSYLYDFLCEAGMTRSDLIIAFGGGMIGDLSGFTAATYLRGVNYVQIPTTLLSQVDASVGGKTAVNLKSGKNLVGAFWQPRMVIQDTELLRTLSDREFAGGMAEVIKYAAIRSRELYDTISACDGRESVMKKMNDIVYDCCDIKRKVVQADERDKGERMILNFGHTFGHAVERLGAYGEITHGEAVSIGMIVAAKLGVKLGVTKPEVADQLKKTAEIFGLPVTTTFTMEEMIEPLSHDKKNMSNTIHLILVHEIGSCEIHPIDLGELEDIMRKADTWMK